MASEYVFRLGDSSSIVPNRASIVHLTGGKQFPSWFSDKLIVDPVQKKETVKSEVLMIAVVVGLYLLLR